MNNYEIEKTVWSEKDFDLMGWHDSRIWSMYANIQDFEFILDLDYIFEWIHPGEEEIYFKFRVAPVTMVFQFVHSVQFDVSSNHGEIGVQDLFMENPTPTPNGKFTSYTFRFDCIEGQILLNAIGFKMYVRSKPRLTQNQQLDLQERGGISFDRKPFQLI